MTQMNINMGALGFGENFMTQALSYPNHSPGRIVSQYKDSYRVICETGEMMAEVSGKFRFAAKTLADYPAVGDFVMLDTAEGAGATAIIHAILPRKSAFVRKAAGASQAGQIVASNIDTVFICMSLNHDFNLRRLERYLALTWESGATPVIVLTKSDLCQDRESQRLGVESAAMGVEIILTSAIEAASRLKLTQYIKPGETIAFVGSSGVGKSTLINCLIGEERIKTNGLRNDDKGRHTTTRRELIVLPSGGMVIDTPGMREIGLEHADLSRAFADIEEQAKACKFHDCTHTGEPNCAVQAAMQAGMISHDRFASYQKLKKEAGYEGMNARQIEEEKLKRMFGSKGEMKNIKKLVKAKNHRR